MVFLIQNKEFGESAKTKGICFGGVDSQGTSSLLIFQLLEQTNNVLYATVIVLVSVLKISRQHS